MDLKMIREIQILALRAVENPNYEAFYRRISRWYSKTFSTPLSEVDKLPEHHILQTYFEDTYGELYAATGDKDGQQKYEEIRSSVLVDPSEREKMQREDNDWVDQMNAEILESQKKEPQKSDSGPEQSQTPVNPNLLIEEKFVYGETAIPEPNDSE